MNKLSSILAALLISALSVGCLDEGDDVPDDEATESNDDAELADEAGLDGSSPPSLAAPAACAAPLYAWSGEIAYFETCAKNIKRIGPDDNFNRWIQTSAPATRKSVSARIPANTPPTGFPMIRAKRGNIEVSIAPWGQGVSVYVTQNGSVIKQQNIALSSRNALYRIAIYNGQVIVKVNNVVQFSDSVPATTGELGFMASLKLPGTEVKAISFSNAL